MLRSTILTRRPLWGYEVVFDLGCDLFLFGDSSVVVFFFPGHMFNSSSILVTGVLGLWFCIEHRMQAHRHSASSIFSSNNCLDFQCQISITFFFSFFQNKLILGYHIYPRSIVCVKINKRCRSVTQTLGRTRTRKDARIQRRSSATLTELCAARSYAIIKPK